MRIKVKIEGLGWAVPLDAPAIQIPVVFATTDGDSVQLALQGSPEWMAA